MITQELAEKRRRSHKSQLREQRRSHRGRRRAATTIQEPAEKQGRSAPCHVLHVRVEESYMYVTDSTSWKRLNARYFRLISL